MTRTIGLVTSSRSDWGIQRPVAQAILDHPDLELQIIATGMHLAAECGHTAEQIEADGFQIAHRVESQQPGDTPESIGRSMGRGVSGFAELFGRWQPDILTVLGDRFDMFPAAVAALPFLIPVAHLHGGESTFGAIDDALRQALTKLSHIHLVATEENARRVHQLGESPEHIHIVGAPGLDDLVSLEPMSDSELEASFGFRPGEVNLLVVYHPETRAFERATQDAEALFAVLGDLHANLVIVRPNSDTANRSIHTAIDQLCKRRPRIHAPVNVPRRAFLSLMRSASAMIGNSSAGIIEAPSFRLPVVNVGNRQSGRLRTANVIDCAADAGEIAEALGRALSPRFRKSIAGLENPYGAGDSARRIARVLATKGLGQGLVTKGARR
jgi:UDP-hydrolysing UDP-N-acetyl-D-glucosamine 2-epimerase